MGTVSLSLLIVPVLVWNFILRASFSSSCSYSSPFSLEGPRFLRSPLNHDRHLRLVLLLSFQPTNCRYSCTFHAFYSPLDHFSALSVSPFIVDQAFMCSPAVYLLPVSRTSFFLPLLSTSFLLLVPLASRDLRGLREQPQASKRRKPGRITGRFVSTPVIGWYFLFGD